MTFRSLAALVFGAGAATLFVALGLLGETGAAPPELRHLRAMKRRLETPVQVARWTLADFQALPHGIALSHRIRRERQAVSFEGWTQRMLVAGDGDVHLELVSTPRRAGGPDTAYVTAEITPAFRRTGGWTYGKLLEVFRPNAGGPTAWEGGPNRVRVTGWLLDDYPYSRGPTPWSLQYAAPRVSGWEIHPVTRIERWNDAGRTWVEVPR